MTSMLQGVGEPTGSYSNAAGQGRVNPVGGMPAPEGWPAFGKEHSAEGRAAECDSDCTNQPSVPLKWSAMGDRNKQTGVAVRSESNGKKNTCPSRSE